MRDKFRQQRLRELPGLGPKSEAWLVEVGITTPDELRALGAIRAFVRLKHGGIVQPGLNFLYALVGAIEGRHWLDVAKHDKGRLLIELEGHDEMENLTKTAGEQHD